MHDLRSLMRAMEAIEGSHLHGVEGARVPGPRRSTGGRAAHVVHRRCVLQPLPRRRALVRQRVRVTNLKDVLGEDLEGHRKIKSEGALRDKKRIDSFTCSIMNALLCVYNILQ